VSVLMWMQPRDHHAAARTVSTLCAVAVAVTVLFLPIAPEHPPLGPWAIAVALAAVLLVALLSVSARFFAEANRLAWAVCPLLAVASIVLIDLLTFDATIAAQVFFLFPTLYGASLLRRPGAAVMTVASVAGEVIVVAAHLPIREAITDAGYMTAALVTTAVLLVRAGERQAVLVSRLEQQAALDPLTGLVTRRVLDEAATSALSGAGSLEGTSLVLLDIDYFKGVNDRYGHPGGDQVLVQLARLLGTHLRRGDVVCRMGGDEIALLLPGCSPEVAHTRAEEVLTRVRAHSFMVGADDMVRLSVSIGLAHAPTDAVDLRRLYVAADGALYGAKHSGRDRVVASHAPELPSG
jgi:diguanylate cyclase (GGDEF)-like protein